MMYKVTVKEDWNEVQSTGSKQVRNEVQSNG